MTGALIYLPPPAMLGGIQGIESVQLTTNGVTLSRRLLPLKKAGLVGVNVSLDTLQSAKFQFITRRKGLDRVLESLEKAVAVGLPQVKVNPLSLSGSLSSTAGELCGDERVK